MRQFAWIQHAFQTSVIGFILSLGITAWAAPESIPSGPFEATYDTGVEHYRNGEFSKALVNFQQIVKAVPESMEAQYYYAITLAQLGRYKDARKAYETVIEQAPGSETAKLAEEGLNYLPTPGKLDTPPQIKRPAEAAPPQQATTPAAAPTAPGGMDPQTMQMMMLMGSMGGKGGFNPMMIPMIQNMGQQPGAPADPSSQLPPSVFSTMMMNQLLQEFTPFTDKED